MNSFLDTSVVIGFCFYLDHHGVKCRRYVSDTILYGGADGFKSTNVDREFNNKVDKKIPEIREELLQHRKKLLQSSVEGSLDALDLEDVKRDHIETDWEIELALKTWYDKEVDTGIGHDDLAERIRKLAKEIESRVNQRSSKLDENLTTISRTKSYSKIESKLTRIPSDDRAICLDAHHVAKNNGGQVELATTNPVHFVNNGREHLIKSETAISNIENLA